MKKSEARLLKAARAMNRIDRLTVKKAVKYGFRNSIYLKAESRWEKAHQRLDLAVMELGE